jgi:hypothetical protein
VGRRPAGSARNECDECDEDSRGRLQHVEVDGFNRGIYFFGDGGHLTVGGAFSGFWAKRVMYRAHDPVSVGIDGLNG